MTSAAPIPLQQKFRQTTPLRLLVSVRSQAEALCAIRGGADILDIKEPNRGSLGMADLSVIHQIAADVSMQEPSLPLSVALGELSDWFDCETIPELPPGVTYAKLGLCHVGGRPDWNRQWIQVRNRFDGRRERPLQWVAVAYADQTAAQSPPLDQVVQAAIESHCAGVLVDTFSKTSGTLFDGVSAVELQRTVWKCHSVGLFLAVAGRVTAGAIPELVDLGADVIAIRSAACVGENRQDSIDATRVASFREVMRIAGAKDAT